ncbi:MAG: DUF4301 family protein [candidate division Zixibacteria bacterium]|nr:DUF4301 family protein [candidate division Zixibacteria bacterium]
MYPFTDNDKRWLAERGIPVEQVLEQLCRFRNGFRFTVVNRPCTTGDGIKILSGTEQERCLSVFAAAVAEGRAMKFVPASGAGSRMFERVFAVRDRCAPADRDTLEKRAATGDEDARYGLWFMQNLPRFPFYEALLSNDPQMETAWQDWRWGAVFDRLLDFGGYGYPGLSKGLLPFHRYPDGVRMPIEEHLVEAIDCTRDRQGVARIHFTVSPEHVDAVTQHIAHIRTRYENDSTRLDIAISVQKPSTDVIAVTPDNEPFRDAQGRLVFRAGGHGALLENMDDLKGDIVFIKNIDNVATDRLKPEIHRSKKILAGYLVSLQTEIFLQADRLEQDVAALPGVREFCCRDLSVEIPTTWSSFSIEEQRSLYARLLERPVRVCGMVRNMGAPGGGPFWVENTDRTTGVQIVETAQIDRNDAGQARLLASATHFNPVDIVGGLRDRKGVPFDLLRFRDPDTGFMATKSKEGRPLKAMEWPGLWNGAMAHWTTVCVEVPDKTFCPVKTIDDLLLPAHRSDRPDDKKNG